MTFHNIRKKGFSIEKNGTYHQNEKDEEHKRNKP